MKKLYDAINDRREIALHRFLFGLGIRHVGEVNAKRFARAYLSYAAFEKAAQEAVPPIEGDRTDKGNEAWQELIAVEGIGSIVAEAVVDFMRSRITCKCWPLFWPK